MPDAFKCSDCGELYSGTPETSIDIDKVDGLIELCEGCVESYVAGLSGHSMTDLSDYSQEELDKQ